MVVVEQGPDPDVSGAATPIEQRCDGVTPAGVPFLVTKLHPSAASAEEAAARRRTDRDEEIVRQFARIRFTDARYVDAISVQGLSADLIRAGDIEALHGLDAARYAGADIVDVRADGPADLDGHGVGWVQVVFKPAFGDVAEVIDEDARPPSPQRGHGDSGDGGSGGGGGPKIGRWSLRRLLMFFGWQVAVTLVVTAVSEPLYGALRAQVSVPLAVPVTLVVGVSLVIGWVVGVKLLDLHRWASRQWHELARRDDNEVLRAEVRALRGELAELRGQQANEVLPGD